MANESKRRIAGMPAFMDPYNPATQGGSVNYGHPSFANFEDHPVEHADDYGGNIAEERSRVEWTRAEWASLAEQYGLAVGGTKQDVIDRVLEYEAGTTEGV